MQEPPFQTVKPATTKHTQKPIVFPEKLSCLDLCPHHVLFVSLMLCTSATLLSALVRSSTGCFITHLEDSGANLPVQLSRPDGALLAPAAVRLLLTGTYHMIDLDVAEFQQYFDRSFTPDQPCQTINQASTIAFRAMHAGCLSQRGDASCCLPLRQQKV